MILTCKKSKESIIAITRSFTVCVALLLFAVGCTGKPAPQRTHESGEPPRAEDPIINPILKSDTDRSGFEELQRIQALVTDGGSVADILTKRIQPLRESAINLDVLSNPESRGSLLTAHIREYNSAVLDLCESAESGAQAVCQTVLNHYEQLVRFNCSDTNIHCELVPVFKETSSSADVWAKIIEFDRGSDVYELQRKIEIGFALTGGQRNSRFDLAFIGSAERVEEYYRANPSADETEKKLRTAHYNNIERLIRQPEKYGSYDQYREYIRYLVRMSERDLQLGQVRVRSSAVKELATLGGIEEKWFLEAVEANISDKPLSYRVSKNFIEENAPETLVNYQLAQNLDPLSPAFQIVNALYTLSWNTNTAKLFWDHSKKDKQKLKAVIQNFVRMQFLRNVILSHKLMGEFYLARDYNRNDIHTRALERSDLVRAEWITFYNRISSIREFAQYAFEYDTDVMRELRIDPSDLNHSVHTYVSTPHMLMLAYRMVVDKFEVKSFFGSVSGRDFFHYIFTHGVSSWFDYRPSGSYYLPINQTTLLFGMHFALNTGAFNFFQVNPKDFHTYIAHELLAPELTLGKVRLELFTHPAKAYEAQLSEMMQVCNEEKEIDSWELTPEETFSQTRHRKYRIITDPHNFRLATMLYSSFGKVFYDFSIYNQQVGANSPLRKYLQFHSNVHQQAINEMRLSFDNKLKLVRNVENIFKGYLIEARGLAADSKELRENLAGIQLEIAKANHFQRRFYTKIDSLLSGLYKECAAFMIRREIDIENALYRTMYEFMKQMYIDYPELKELSGRIATSGEGSLSEAESERYRALKSRYQVSHSQLSDFSGFDHFDFERDSFVNYQLDSLIRMYTFLSSGYQSDSFKTGPINDGIRLLMPVDGLEDLKPFYANPVVLKFSEAKTADEFASRAMRHFQGYDFGENFHVLWNKGHTWWGEFFMRDQINFYLNLWKVGRYEVYDDTAGTCIDGDYKEECEEHVKVSEMDLELMVRDTFKIYELKTSSESDRESYRLLGLKDRGQTETFEVPGLQDREPTVYGGVAGYLFHPKTREAMGLFDYHFIVLNMEDLGWSIGYSMPWSPPRENAPTPGSMPLERAKDFVMQIRDGESLILPLSDVVTEFLLNDIRAGVDSEFDRIFEFADRLQVIEREEREQGIVHFFPFEAFEGRTDDLPFVTNLMIRDTRDRLDSFHQQTLFYLDPERRKVGE